MCGIAGTVGLADRDIVKLMIEAIAHRGPDDQGIYLDSANQVALGHRRLSIIDLSAAGHQPMSYGDGRYWITFNGEIYNYQEIRLILEQHNHRFKSTTDTEVILAAYAEWGSACVEHLRGMFAFAIYDSGSHPDDAHLFLARDRFGIKPLYYAQINGVFLFASELKALRASGLISAQVDHQAIWDYLSLGSVPQPRTIFADVKALLPGHVMLLKHGNEIKTYRYWDIATNSEQNFPKANITDRVTAAQQLRHLLEESTRLHLIADVPVGAFLSGGIDSTAVVGLMSQYVSHPIKTYSIGFESQHSHLSELKWAKLASERFQTDHTEVIVTADEVAREYDNLICAIDQPSIDGTNSYFVSKATRTGVTVALSGLGGDELFAGYPHFRRLKLANQLNQLFQLVGNPGKKLALNLLPSKYFTFRQLKKFIGESPLAWHTTIRSLADEEYKQKITSHTLQERCEMIPLSDFYKRILKTNLDVVAQMSYVELNGYMVNTLLRDVDAMSMAAALEVRPLLLDHVLAEFAFAQCSEFKLTGTTGKSLLIDALRDLIPEPIIKRPKMGFQMPLWDWLTGSLLDRAKAAFKSHSARKLFKEDFITTAIADLETSGIPKANLWGYVLMLEWLDLHKCEI